MKIGNYVVGEMLNVPEDPKQDVVDDDGIVYRYVNGLYQSPAGTDWWWFEIVNDFGPVYPVIADVESFKPGDKITSMADLEALRSIEGTLLSIANTEQPLIAFNGAWEQFMFTTKSYHSSDNELQDYVDNGITVLRVGLKPPVYHEPVTVPELDDVLIENLGKAAFNRPGVYRGCTWNGVNQTTEATRDEYRENARAVVKTFLKETGLA